MKTKNQKQSIQMKIIGPCEFKARKGERTHFEYEYFKRQTILTQDLSVYTVFTVIVTFRDVHK